ncbi:purine nucleoside phosphorylase YfiH [Rouxiella sp. Mn2063]|uniref:purine nucleoside phosphorylase YfiH n=1 Tax=Rouxiella sp. Mn2063 TaxID=3395262 RepID=UPI003BC3E87B
MGPLIPPNWPQPASVQACATTRHGGVSLPPYESLNLGGHVGDAVEAVASNRQRLMTMAELPGSVHWLEQVHGTNVARLTGDTSFNDVQTADAAYTNESGVVCAVMTADCLPVLFCSRAGDEVAAAHAGWRGLNAGVLENTVAAFHAQPQDIIAWMGPAIGAKKFEVGPEVRDAFITSLPESAVAFSVFGEKYLADIFMLARLRLQACGLINIYGGEFCTVTDSDNFFSYRRDGTTGRLASLIWLR